jgi:hypothetical protein
LRKLCQQFPRTASDAEVKVKNKKARTARAFLFFVFEATGSVAVLPGVEALIAQEQAGIAVAVQVSTEAEASDETAEEAMAATPVEAGALAAVRA